MTDEVQSSQNADDHRAAFNREDAVQLIVAGITAGKLDFPFSKGLNTESLLNRAKDLCKQAGLEVSDATVAKFRKDAIAATALAARLDAVYFLTLQQTLMSGLTEEEAQRITGMAKNL